MATGQTKARLRCDQIMHRPVESILEDDTIACAARRMREHDIGFLPVCDRSGTVVGVLTDRDIALRSPGDRRPDSISVGEVMTHAVVACTDTDPITRVEHCMREHRITRVVIVDSAGRPTGIISLSDLSQYEGATKIGRTFREIAERKYAPERI